MKAKRMIKPNELIEDIVEFVKARVEDDFRVGSGRSVVLDAYNRYREDECACIGYIFQINKMEDLNYLGGKRGYAPCGKRRSTSSG